MSGESGSNAHASLRDFMEPAASAAAISSHRRRCARPRPAHAQSPAEFYKGKNVDLYIGYSVGGAYDLYAARHRPPPRQAHPGQSDHRPEEHGRRRQPAARQLALQCRPEGRHRVRHHRPRHRLRSAARLQGRAIRRRQVHLDRQRQRRGQRLRRLEGQRRRQARGRAAEGADRRRHRPGRRHRPIPAHPQRRARHQVQDRHRLSRRQRRRWRWSAAR